MKPTIIRRTRADKLFDTLNVILMAIVLVITLYPLYFVLIASVSDAYEVAKGNVFLWPKGFTAESYLNVFKENRVWLGYRNTLFYTLTGTFFSLILTIPSAYALSKKTLPGRRLINVFFLIPMYFNGRPDSHLSGDEKNRDGEPVVFADPDCGLQRVQHDCDPGLLPVQRSGGIVRIRPD